MTARRLVTVAAPLAVCLMLAAWIALSAASAQAASMSLLVYALANLIVYTDALDFALRMSMRRQHGTRRGSSDEYDVSIELPAARTVGGAAAPPPRPYAIIASIFNLSPELDRFMEAFARYRERVWLVSDGSTDDTVARLKQSGWHCLEESVNRRKPAALRDLLAALPQEIETVLVVDPDIHVRGRHQGSQIELEEFIADFQRSGAAAACPRVMIEPDGFLARFQAFEYALSFRVGRRSLGDYSITSGVSVYRRDALAAALHVHTLSVYAEDLENAVVLLARGERIYYDGRLLVSTEGPGTVRRWFSQRVGWYHGLLRVYTQRLREVLRISRRTPFAMYHFIIYVGVLSLAAHLLKMVSAALLLLSFAAGFDALFLTHLVPSSQWTDPAYFMAAVGSYLLLGVVALFTVVPAAERAYIAPIVPLYLFYALVHIAPMTVGFGNWIAVRFLGRRLYRDHYEPGPAAPPLLGASVIARRLP